MKHPKGLIVIGAAMLFLLIGCGPDWKAEVTSDTSWTGAFAGRTQSEFVMADVQGRGNTTIDLPDDKRICCIFVQKGKGSLRVKVKDEGGGLFHLLASNNREGQTNVDGGRVELCNDAD